MYCNLNIYAACITICAIRYCRNAVAFLTTNRTAMIVERQKINPHKVNPARNVKYVTPNTGHGK